MKLSRWIVFATAFAAARAAAATTDDALINTVRALDTVLFEAGYNQCDMQRLANVIADDLEFYHDQGGPSFGKQAFLAGMQKGICESEYNPRRELVEDSLEVFPLYRNGTLYGVIEQGVHRFHETPPGKREHPTGIARFTLLWLLKDGEWKLARALSFDHVGLH